jgi:hypothetical protein
MMLAGELDRGFVRKREAVETADVWAPQKACPRGPEPRGARIEPGKRNSPSPSVAQNFPNARRGLCVDTTFIVFIIIFLK